MSPFDGGCAISGLTPYDERKRSHRRESQPQYQFHRPCYYACSIANGVPRHCYDRLRLSAFEPESPVRNRGNGVGYPAFD